MPTRERLPAMLTRVEMHAISLRTLANNPPMVTVIDIDDLQKSKPGH